MTMDNELAENELAEKVSKQISSIPQEELVEVVLERAKNMNFSLDKITFIRAIKNGVLDAQKRFGSPNALQILVESNKPYSISGMLEAGLFSRPLTRGFPDFLDSEVIHRGGVREKMDDIRVSNASFFRKLRRYPNLGEGRLSELVTAQRLYQLTDGFGTESKANPESKASPQLNPDKDLLELFDRSGLSLTSFKQAIRNPEFKAVVKKLLTSEND